MPLLEVVWIALLGGLSGLMIGCVGIGGVILVPALVFLAGIAIQIAIPAAMFADILSGLVTTAVFACRGLCCAASSRAPWSSLASLFSPMSPGACSDSGRRRARPTPLSIFVTERDGRSARYSLTTCGQPPSLRAAALDSLRSLRMWSTTTFLALPAIRKTGGVRRRCRSCEQNVLRRQ